MTESKIPISTCRLQGATLRKVRSLKHTEIRPSDDISYVIKKDCGKPTARICCSCNSLVQFTAGIEIILCRSPGSGIVASSAFPDNPVAYEMKLLHYSGGTAQASNLFPS